MFSPHNQTPVFLNAITTKRKPLVSSKLDGIGSVADRVSGEATFTSGVILEPACPLDEGR